MMRKLLKYDLRSGIRVFGFVWLGMVLFTALVCLLFSLPNQDSNVVSVIGVMGLIPTLLGIVGAGIFAEIFVALRFYNGMLGREGYLMFTLPTEPGKLLASKLISSVIFMGVTNILSIGGLLAIVFSLMSGMNIDLQPLLDYYNIEATLDWSLAITVLGQLVSITTGVLQIYLACCLGHLCRGRRGVRAISFYLLLSISISFLSSLLARLFSVNLDSELGPLAQNALYYTIPFNIGLSILFFFFSERILRTKLNLE